MRTFGNILVTGGAGFIGSNFIRYVFQQPEFTGRIINLDKLTYAGNEQNLDDVKLSAGDRYVFVNADICDFSSVCRCMAQYDVDCIVHFAAESHVDRSIHGPAEFIRTNINGTFTLLEACRLVWGDRRDVLFHHVSTDEVFGSLGETGYFYETTPYDPRSPYSASKASSDHLVMSYFHTYGLNVTLSNCSNNYGPFQSPEKLIPSMLKKMLSGEQLPIYGDGMNIRDWLYVSDHCGAVWDVIKRGAVGQRYNVSGENELNNLAVVGRLCGLVSDRTGKSKDFYKGLIVFVEDRQGHDRRYAVKCDKIMSELGWKRTVAFDEGLSLTVNWYLANYEWLEFMDKRIGSETPGTKISGNNQ